MKLKNINYVSIYVLILRVQKTCIFCKKRFKCDAPKRNKICSPVNPLFFPYEEKQNSYAFQCRCWFVYEWLINYKNTLGEYPCLNCLSICPKCNIVHQ